MRYYGQDQSDEDLLIGTDFVDPETGYVMGTECKPWQFLCRAKARTEARKALEKSAAEATFKFDYGTSVVKPIHWALLGVAALGFFGFSLYLDRR